MAPSPPRATLDLSGEETIDPSDLTSVVFYLVFELADGDLRRVHDAAEDLDLSLIFRTLHDVAVGIRQLHSAEIAHQDIKPSNVLAFKPPAGRSQRVSRLADLGRASRPDAKMPHDAMHCAGDLAHTAPELLFATTPPTWNGRRACDLYQLGSILLFMFSGVSATAAWSTELHSDYLPRCLGGTYIGDYEDALPHVRDAMQRVCENFPRFAEERVRDVALRLFRRLCDPDPRLRGDTVGTDQYGLERVISELDLEANRTARRIVKKIA